MSSLTYIAVFIYVGKNGFDSWPATFRSMTFSMPDTGGGELAWLVNLYIYR